MTSEKRPNELTAFEALEQINSGSLTSEELGDPLTVLEWTASHLSALGDGIKAGEVVSTGTCTGVTLIAPDETFVADFEELGRIEVRFVRKR